MWGSRICTAFGGCDPAAAHRDRAPGNDAPGTGAAARSRAFDGYWDLPASRVSPRASDLKVAVQGDTALVVGGRVIPEQRVSELSRCCGS